MNKNIKKVYFFLILSLFSTFSLSAASIKAIIVGDSVDTHIGAAAKLDVIHLQEFLTSVSDYTDLPLQATVLIGKSAVADNVMNYIDMLQVDPDDIVLVYFSAHGVNNHQVTKWPHVLFDTDDSNVDFDLINSMIKNKGPKLLISIADCCNKILPNSVHLEKLGFRSGKDKQLVRENFRKLFLNVSGSIIISSSQPGQYSWSSAREGSDFTLMFLKCFDEVVSQEESVDWENILDYTTNKVSSITHSKGKKQTPQYVLDLF
jgi:hypothetical protein